MKSTVIIPAAVCILSGCGWLLPGKKAPVVAPAHQRAAAAPAAVRPSDPAPPAPGTTQPAPYKHVTAPKVVAATMLQVNEQFITLQQVLRPIQRQLQAAAGPDEQAFRRRAVELIAREVRNQVEQAVLVAEAEKEVAEKEKTAIAEQVNDELRRRIAELGSRALFDERLAAEGMDLATWLEDMRRAIMVNHYLRRHFKDRIEITRRGMLAYYRAHREEFRTSEGVQMQIIAAPFRKFLPADRAPSDADREAARKEARGQIDRAAAALAKGEEFGKVAKAFSKGPMASTGGPWPMMERGSFRAKAVEEAAFAQKTGQVSGVLEAELGYYIVKTAARREGSQRAFEDVQAEIEQKLHRQQYDRLRREYLRGIQSKTTVTMAEEFQRLAVDAAVRMCYSPR